MNVKTRIGLALACGVTLVLARTGMSQESGQDAGVPNMEMMMEAMKIAGPGPEHAELAKMAGEWEDQVTIAMPGAAPMEATNANSSKLILGGRFLEIVSTGNYMGQAFESRSIVGFDRRHEQYTMIGLDTLGTYWVSAKGTKDVDGIIRMRGEDVDPIMGKQVYSFEFELVSEDEIIQRVVFESMGGQQFDPPHAMVTIHSKRKK